MISKIVKSKTYGYVMKQLCTGANLLVLWFALWISMNFAPSLWKYHERDPTIAPPSYYVPKSQRWKRTTTAITYTTQLVTAPASLLLNWIGTFESTWHEKKSGWAQNRRYSHALRVAREMNEPEEEEEEEFFHRRRRPRRKRTYRSWSQHRDQYQGPFNPRRWKRFIVNETIHVMGASNAYGERVHDNIARFDTDSAKIGIDNRCSACISHCIEDFEGPVRKVNRAIKGFGGERMMDVFQGTIAWKWCDNNGMIHRFRIPNSYYVPDGKVRLLSPQHWAKTQIGSSIRNREGTGEKTLAHKTTLFWNNGANQLDVYLGAQDNVATFYLAPGFKRFGLYCQECKIDYNATMDEPLIVNPTTVVSDDEDDDDDDVEPPPKQRLPLWSRLTGLPMGRRQAQEEANTPTHTPTQSDFNLNGPTAGTRPRPVVIEEEEDRQPTTDASQLLRYHHKFGHISFAKLRNMAKQNIIPRKLADCPVPACSSCMFAKATRRQWRNKRRRNFTNNRVATKPGDVVSVDQLVSPTPGLVAQLTGKLTTRRYKYATVYVDQFSGLGYVYLQKSATADETILGKKAFEAYCKQNGVTVRHYHADNGIFRANKWVDECRENGQGLTFAGVNAHHSNGLAERRIRSLQDLTRSMLIHQDRRWTGIGSVYLWPYALRMANDAINESPNLKDKEGRSPLQLFSGAETTNVSTKHWIPFGCPVYVLEAPLQSGRGIHNKWEYRSKVGIYLGRSPNHGRNIALVLDRTTGLVSPQFHVAFDPSFHTTKQDTFDSLWQLKAGFIAEAKEAASKKRKSSSETIYKKVLPGQEGAQPERKKRKLSGESNQKPDKVETRSTLADPDTLQQLTDDSLSAQPRESDINLGAPQADKPPEIQKEQQSSEPAMRVMETMIAELSNATANNDVPGEIFCFQAMFPNYAGMPEEDPLQVFKATSDPDTMYMHQAMKEPDAPKFREAMQKEWDDQLGNGNFTVKKRSEVPEGAIVLPAVWQMKRKRDIKTREIKKYKARLNIDGSRMKPGIHYDQTYAPVANWNSIRTLLIMSALHGWHTRQIDYVLAFPQAPVERQIFMEIPKGFKMKDNENTGEYVLELHRNVYGQPQSGRVWNKFLTDILVNKVGFKQSKVDECVFYRGSVMYVLYTDDSILAGPDLGEIDKAIADIKAAKLNITVEGDLQDFLGINIERKDDGTIHLTQPQLIDQILKDLHLKENTKPKSTPASSSKLLSRHSDSEDFDGHFNYRSVIGKLNYLEKGSRPDIAYITHQCARFSSCPKKEHGEAVKWLGRYLLGTRDKGMILKPDGKFGLDVYVDADFAGNWDPKETQDRDTARSRHGYFIMFANCPILWKSQLQTEVALSSTESEFTGLSYALRDAIPIMNLIKEMKARGLPMSMSQTKVHCRVFEDNSGALEIAKIPKFRPRTKHLNVRLHHFRSYVDDTKEISIHKIDTKEQPADMLTKPLNEEGVVKHRERTQGWT